MRMRVVYFVRVVRLGRPLEHALLARILERCLGVTLADLATLGYGFELVSVALLDKRRRYDVKAKVNKYKIRGFLCHLIKIITKNKY